MVQEFIASFFDRCWLFFVLCTCRVSPPRICSGEGSSLDGSVRFVIESSIICFRFMLFYAARFPVLRVSAFIADKGFLSSRFFGGQRTRLAVVGW